MSNPEEKQPTCAQRWAGSLENTVGYLQHAYRAWHGETVPEDDPQFWDGDIGPESLYEYGLSFEYQCDEDDEDCHFVWCLSWGGPADYLHFYASPGRHGMWVCSHVEYQFQDWFDNHTKAVEGPRGEFLRQLFNELFGEHAQFVYEKGVDDSE